MKIRLLFLVGMLFFGGMFVSASVSELDMLKREVEI